MPNYCDNSVNIQFNNSKIYYELKEKYLKDDTIFFEHILPKTDDNMSNREWNLEKWGTKWDIDGEIHFDDKYQVVNGLFNTAWSPPINIYKFLYNEWKCDINALYYELGQYYCGVFVYNENEKRNDCYEINDFISFAKNKKEKNINLTDEEYDLYEIIDSFSIFEEL